jgi:hypothetical protein
VVADELERGHAVVIASDRFAIDDAGGERRRVNVSTIAGNR